MNIQQIIYTKVDTTDSPSGMADFHTVFYPVNLMAKGDIFALEKNIHVPDLHKTDSKNAVYFQPIQNELYLVILCFKNLPNDRDTFGRRGLFLVHGFLFPQVIWRKSLSPKDLLSLVKENLFTERRKLLNSDIVNRKTGNIEPLVVSDQQVESLARIHGPCSSLEIEVAQLLINIAQGSENELLIRGSAKQVSEFMCRVIAAVPDDLKVDLGWDCSFDGDTMFYSPFKIVGFEVNQPAAKNPVIVDVMPGMVSKKPEDGSEFKPTTPYQKWLASCKNRVINKSAIESLYILSLHLDTGHPFQGSVPANEKSNFLVANEEKIRNIFHKQCQSIMDIRFTDLISQHLSASAMFDLIIKDMSLISLAFHLTEAIYSSNLSPKFGCKRIPEKLVADGNLELVLIDRVWQGDKLTTNDFLTLNCIQSQNLIRYLLHSKWSTKEWFIDLLVGSKDLCHIFLLTSDYKEEIQILFDKFIKKKNRRLSSIFWF